MIWRAAAAFVVLFWAVMTGLLLRDVYFPDESRFAEVPPKYVFDLFLKQAEVTANTLHLYHRDQKIGHASLSIASGRDEDRRTYQWLLRGVVERLQNGGTRIDTTWEVDGRMNEEGDWQQLDLTAAMPHQNADLKVRWLEGERFPEVNVTQNGRVVVNSQNIAVLMALGMGGMQGMSGDWAQALAPLAASKQEMPPPEVTAREGTVSLAGRERKCFLVSVELPGSQKVRMIFSETGELARIDLPQDYRLIEPMIHGMIPSLPTPTETP